ncbi:DUF7504 family protein [Halobacterium jilantaiense]|uniref:Uncharacterized protein n=1 Tax=Halobacterium jilantaiense TaxID=355548 RepID=A0A1I0MZC5_9EURY|nr:hypothetical protein [Halobacterium jilantaiense]SEV94172.1 hypothetical protein SAMN04487945_0494 [Halobacterium jilantaiense]
MSDHSAGGEWSSSPETFASTLEDLKQSGCMVLVVEDEDAPAHEGCDRLLGADDAADRRRLFVQTDSATSSRLTVAGRRDRTTERVARLRTTSRTATATDATQAVPGASPTVATGVDGLAADAREAVDALEPTDGFDAGQLRICVDSVGDMVAATNPAATTGFVADVRELVDDHDGLGHVHVTQRTPGAAAEALLPQMDAVVEVAGDEEARHRWHLPEESLTSEWFDLERA